MRVVFLLGLLFSQTNMFADEAAEKDFAVEVKASFGNFDTELNRITVSLGELPADEHIDATIKLVNVSQSTIEFLSLHKSCNCLEAKVVNSKVAPTKSADILITLHTRLRSFSPKQETTFQVQTKQDDRIEKSTIVLEYSLRGVVAFPLPAFHHEIPVGAKRAELRLPLLVTEPIVGSKIEVDAELNTLPQLIRDTEDKEKWWVVLPVDTNLLRNDLSIFKVKVSDPTTGREAEATVSLDRAAAFRVSPRILRFRRSSADGSLFATSIISVGGVPGDENSSDNQKLKEVTDALLATATVDGKPVRLAVEPLGRNVFRVETKLDEHALQLDNITESKIHWSFICGKLKGNVASLFVVNSQ